MVCLHQTAKKYSNSLSLLSAKCESRTDRQTTQLILAATSAGVKHIILKYL